LNLLKENSLSVSSNFKKKGNFIQEINAPLKISFAQVKRCVLCQTRICYSIGALMARIHTPKIKQLRECIMILEILLNQSYHILKPTFSEGSLDE
jgi:hypothetical protein